MPLRAVIFDMDGVLTATVEPHYRSWKEVLDLYRIPFTRQDNEKLLGLTRRRSLEVILGERKLPEAQIQEILQRKNEVYLQYVQRMGPGDLLPGVARLLAELREQRIRVGVASASRNTLPVLQNLGIVASIDALADGNTVARSKPAPDVFLQAAAALGVDPGDCIAIEDSSAGVQAARSAGMCVVGLGSPGRVSHAHAIFPDLANVRVDDLVEVYALLPLG